MFHDLSANIIEDVLVVAISWEDVLPNNHSESGSESGSDVIQLFVDTNVNIKLVIQFEGEEGIDDGAFTVEYEIQNSLKFLEETFLSQWNLGRF